MLPLPACLLAHLLQIALMREGLRDKVIQGQRWRLGSKKREDVIRDYRCGVCVLSLKCGGYKNHRVPDAGCARVAEVDIDSPTTPAAAPLAAGQCWA